MQIFAHFSIGKHKILNLFECLIDQFDNIILILMCILSAYGYPLVNKYYFAIDVITRAYDMEILKLV